MDLRQSEATFPDTMWSLVTHAENEADAACTRARQALASVYWPAVYAYLRHTGRGRDEAEELTQAFFSDVVAGRALLSGVTRERGRLRTLIISALKNYMVDVHRRKVARRADCTWSLDAPNFEPEENRTRLGDGESPEVGFDRRWAAALVSEALHRCLAHFVSSGRGEHWRLFEARILRPIAGPTDPPPLAVVANEFGFRSAADAAAAVQVVKKRLEAIMREVAAETTAPGDDAEDEWIWLQRTLET